MPSVKKAQQKAQQDARKDGKTLTTMRIFQLRMVGT
jgi:hypothetical protein